MYFSWVAKKKKNLITQWIKIIPLIHSLSLSLISEHHSPFHFGLTRSLRPLTLSLRLLTSSLRPTSHSHSDLSLSHSGFSFPHSGRPLTLTPISHSLNSDHPSPRSTPSADPARWRDRCLLIVGFFFFFPVVDRWWWWWWWWLWLWLWPWLRKKDWRFGFFFFKFFLFIPAVDRWWW